MPVKGECHEVAAGEALCDSHGFAEQRVSCGDVAVAHALARKRAEQPSPLDARLVHAVDQPLRPREPAGRLGPLIGDVGKDKRQPECASSSLQVPPAFEEAGMRARPRLNTGLVFPHQVRSARKAIEVIGLERCRGVRD